MVKCVGKRNENMISVNPLVVQCLGLGAFTAGGREPSSSPTWGTKTLQADWYGQKISK